MNPAWREDLKGDYGGLFTLQGLERLQLSLRGLYVIAVMLLIAVHYTWEIMMIKFSINQSIFV